MKKRIAKIAVPQKGGHACSTCDDLLQKMTEGFQIQNRMIMGLQNAIVQMQKRESIEFMKSDFLIQNLNDIIKHVKKGVDIVKLLDDYVVSQFNLKSDVVLNEYNIVEV